MGWMDTLKDLWTTPSINAAPLLAEQRSVALIQKAIVENDEKAIKEIQAALEKDKIFKTAIKNGRVFAEDTRQVKTQAEINAEFKAITEGGIITLQPKLDEEQQKKRDDFIKATIGPDGAKDGSDEANDCESRYNGFNIKKYPENGTNLSFMRVVKVDTREVLFPKPDMVTPGITQSKFKQFILLQKSIASTERMQVVEWGKHFQALFFDRKPEYLQIAGALKNTLDCPWTMNMIFAWDEYFRGTRLVEQGAICQLYVDGEIYEGYPFNFSRSKSANNDFLTNFSMTFLVRERIQVYD